MKKINLIKLFVLTLLFCSNLNPTDVLSDNNACPEIHELTYEYIEEHKKDTEKRCSINGYANEKCFDKSDTEYDNFINCWENCGGNSPDVCEEEFSRGDCSWHECTTKIDNDCAIKCKHHLLLENNSSDYNNSSNKNNTDLIGLPVDSSISTVLCIGETPKNAALCPDDGKEIFYYTEKKLVSSCSIPEGSEPKCEYICKTKLLNNGVCKEVGFFEKILNWISSLF